MTDTDPLAEARRLVDEAEALNVMPAAGERLDLVATRQVEVQWLLAKAQIILLRRIT